MRPHMLRVSFDTYCRGVLSSSRLVVLQNHNEHIKDVPSLKTAFSKEIKMMRRKV